MSAERQTGAAQARLLAAAPELLAAVQYVLDRCQDNPDVGYYLGWGTEMFHRLTKAEASALGEPLETVEARRSVDTQPPYRRRDPDAVTLRDERDALRRLCEDHGINWSEAIHAKGATT